MAGRVIQRSLSDEEVALIRAILSRGMKSQSVQFYFNRHVPSGEAGWLAWSGDSLHHTKPQKGCRSCH